MIVPRPPAFVPDARVTAASVTPVDAFRGSAENMTREWTGNFTVLDEALRQDQAELEREVLLWQRWIRYGAAIAWTACPVSCSTGCQPAAPGSRVNSPRLAPHHSRPPADSKSAWTKLLCGSTATRSACALRGS